ncbi:MAG: zinc ribbon domain-containing protein [Pseudohongiellaceae bacterium]
MKICTACGNSNPAGASFCMHCGRRLADRTKAGPGPWNTGSTGIFLLTLGASLLLSFILIGVFKLPIFILGAFLPLFWFNRKSG